MPAKLSAKYKLAITSATYCELIKERLKAHNILDYFSLILPDMDVKNHKPHPEVLHLCLEKLNLKPEEVLYVGDMIVDIKAGKSAGIKTVIISAYSWNSKRHLLDHKPDIVVERPEELLEILLKNNRAQNKI